MSQMPTFSSTVGHLGNIAALHAVREQAIRDHVGALRAQAADTYAAATVIQARVGKKKLLLKLLRAKAARR